MKFEKKNWQFWHKFVAWVSNMLFMCPGKPFHEENASTKIYSLLFFEQGVFQIFADSFIGSVAKHAIYVTGNVFSWNDFSRKLFVCIIFFQSLSRRFLDFCPFYWQVCIQRVHRNFSEEKFFSNKNQHCFSIFRHKKWILKNNSACCWKLPPTHPEEHSELLFWICS